MSTVLWGFVTAGLTIAVVGCNGSTPSSSFASGLSSRGGSPTASAEPKGPEPEAGPAPTPANPPTPDPTPTTTPAPTPAPPTPPAPSTPPAPPPPPPAPVVPLATTLPARPALSTGILWSRVAAFTPAENPLTASKVTLGKALFWDQQLGARNNQACASCHSRAGADPRSMDALGRIVTASVHPGPDGILGTPDDIVGSMGVRAGKIRDTVDGFTVDDDFTPQFFMPPALQVTGRQAPSSVNAVFNRLNFWDGRAGSTFRGADGTTVCADNGSAESQAVGPPLSPVEMACSGETWQHLTNKIAKASVLALQAGPGGADIANVSMLQGVFGRTYPELFQAAFGDPAVTRERIGLAIAAYERTQISDATPYDRFVAGDLTALTATQTQGLDIFRGKGGCVRCHVEGWLTDAVTDAAILQDGTLGFHNLGVRPVSEDHGRMNVTQSAAQDGAFKTPHLRNIKLTAPYFHNGGKRTLEEVVDFYNNGGDFANRELKPLGLKLQDKAALVAFLRDGLTDPNVEAETAPFDHPPLR